MHLQNQLNVVVQSRGKYSTSSLATAPEMLASEVTPGLLAEVEPDARGSLAHPSHKSFVYHPLINLLKEVGSRPPLLSTYQTLVLESMLLSWVYCHSTTPNYKIVT